MLTQTSLEWESFPVPKMPFPSNSTGLHLHLRFIRAPPALANEEATYLRTGEIHGIMSHFSPAVI